MVEVTTCLNNDYITIYYYACYTDMIPRTEPSSLSYLLVKCTLMTLVNNNDYFWQTLVVWVLRTASALDWLALSSCDKWLSILMAIVNAHGVICETQLFVWVRITIITILWHNGVRHTLLHCTHEVWWSISPSLPVERQLSTQIDVYIHTTMTWSINRNFSSGYEK